MLLHDEIAPPREGLSEVVLEDGPKLDPETTMTMTKVLGRGCQLLLQLQTPDEDGAQTKDLKPNHKTVYLPIKKTVTVFHRSVLQCHH